MLPHQLIVLHLCAMSGDDHTYKAACCAASVLPSNGPVPPPGLSELCTSWAEPFIDGVLPIPAGTQPDATGNGGAPYGSYQAPLADQAIPPPPADNRTWALQQFVSYQQEVPPPPPD